MAVDGTLFPLDTLKTRLQSPDGFRQSGGFRGIYSGLGPAILGSAPTGKLFLVSYAMQASKISFLCSPIIQLG